MPITSCWLHKSSWWFLKDLGYPTKLGSGLEESGIFEFSLAQTHWDVKFPCWPYWTQLDWFEPNFVPFPKKSEKCKRFFVQMKRNVFGGDNKPYLDILKINFNWLSHQWSSDRLEKRTIMDLYPSRHSKLENGIKILIFPAVFHGRHNNDCKTIFWLGPGP